jgi:diadenosine tetraphosphate (Ap4A) HIT family hydrolase
MVVANCHKLPASHFNRYFVPTERTVEHLKETILKLKQVNPAIKILFSVSPVRHWKDGAVENQRSKAALILAVATIEKELDNVYNFPAYEIFMDELRDYRFLCRRYVTTFRVCY